MRLRDKALLFSITLLAAQSFAQPPSVQIPTGACAGIIKRSTVSTLDEAAEHGPIASVFDLYIDFDNLLTYSTGVFEVRSGGNDFAGSAVFADGDPFTLTPPTIAPYALDLRRTGENQDGTTSEIYVRLIPENDGQSFLVVTSSDTGTPYSGVCQKI